MTTIIVYRNSLNGVCICTPTGEVPIEHVIANDLPQDVEYRITDDSTLPINDWDFRDAWEYGSNAITVNFTLAKEITRKRLREERAPLLAEQDVLFQRAIESGSDYSAITEEKARLRDITLLVDLCLSLSELRALKAAKQ